MSSSTPVSPHARSTRSRILGIRTRDVAIALAAVVVGSAALAIDAAADADAAGDVRTAAVGSVQPAAVPVAMGADALRVDAYDGIGAGADRLTALAAPVDNAADIAAAEEARAAAEAAAQRGAMWDRLADCESGDWDANSQPIPGSARWDYGLTFSHGDIFEGGVNFHPQTWDEYRHAGMPGHAGEASRAQQIAVAEEVLADQGWGAWPVCSRKLGLR